MSVAEAIAELRSDATPVSVVLATFDPENFKDEELRVAYKGEGSIEEIVPHLPARDVAYGLVRKAFTHEKVGSVTADTVKFVWVSWRPEAGVPLKRKMKLSALDGKIRKLFSPFHVQIEATQTSEVSDGAVNELLESVTMTKNVVTDRKGASMYRGGASVQARTATSDASAAKMAFDSRVSAPMTSKGAVVSVDDESTLAATIAEYRSDSTATNWLLYSYADASLKKLTLAGKGEGGLEELLAACPENAAAYGIFRFGEHIDLTVVPSFCFIMWLPKSISIVSRAKIATHKGTVTPFFRPFHKEFTVNDRTELTEAQALAEISALSGTKSHVVSASPARTAKTVGPRSMLGGVSRKTQSIKIADEDALQAAISDVRNDSSSANWMLAGHDSDMALTLISVGDDGLSGLKANLDDGQVQYALLRTVEQIDRSTVVKFLFVLYQGKGVSPLARAKLGTLKGAIVKEFGAFNAEVFCTDRGDLTEDMVADKVKKR